MAGASTEGPPERLIGRWNRFWYAEGNPSSLGLFRALFAICLALELPVTRARNVFAIQGGFHLPYLPFPTPIPPELYQLMHALQFPFVALLGVGILPRLSAGVLLGLQGYNTLSRFGAAESLGAVEAGDWLPTEVPANSLPGRFRYQRAPRP